MGYQQGLSGLSASSSDLDVIGNNIANANTVGFKSGAAQFADMYANSVATAVGNQVGIGTKLAEVQQQFSQGTITSTNQALDVAINGNGFFQLSNNGSLVYSRNGVFQLDKNGFITNAQGLQLMGYAANSSGIINTAQTVPLSVPTANIAPQATTKIVAGLNLNAQDPLMLGTPVVSVTSEALIEISGDAVLFVDPDDVEDMARALATIVNDSDLRGELSRRGIDQAAKFSLARYRERLRSLYASLA